MPLNTKVSLGDKINLYLLDEYLSSSPITLDKKDIVYDDDLILVANKKAGLLSISENENDDTLDKRIKEYLHSQEGSICHRLDMGTMGLIIYAKTSLVEEEILKAIKDRQLQKHYVCITVGWPNPASGKIDTYLKKSEDGFVKVVKENVEDAKQAITLYTTLSKKDNLAYVDVEILTGRTHQIRVHLKHISCPILGDSKYGIDSVNKKYKMKRQCLCSYKIQMPIFTGVCAPLSNKVFEIPKPTFGIFD